MIIKDRIVLEKRSQHCVESVRIRSFSGPYFPAFGLNTGFSRSAGFINSSFSRKTGAMLCTPLTPMFEGQKISGTEDVTSNPQNIYFK